MPDELEASRDERIEALWKKLDLKGRGVLDAEGLKKGLAKINHPLQNAQDLLGDVMQAVDSDGDGLIQYSEFHDFVQKAEKELWQLFKSIDYDGDNKLDKHELYQAFTKAGIHVSKPKLDEFFAKVDSNHDGVITFDEWRNFLLFLPTDNPGLKAIYSYFTASVKVNPEGDVHLSDETIQGLGTTITFTITLRHRLFAFLRLFEPIAPPRIRHRPPDPSGGGGVGATPVSAAPSALARSHEGAQEWEPWHEGALEEDLALYTPDAVAELPKSLYKRLMDFLPNPGYFLAGGIAGIISRTSTAPLDRLKVYLIAQTGSSSEAVAAAKSGAGIQATKAATNSLVEATKALWRAGGVRSLWAGNGLNVAKVMPESAIKFGSYEASKRFVATLEGHGDPTKISGLSQFISGGMGGIISQAFVYPVDTLKFRMQCETVEGGHHGNRLIIETAKKMLNTASPLRTFYRGLPMGLVGMFPYSAIDLSTFEYLKRAIITFKAKQKDCHEDDVVLGAVSTAAIGGFSGALGASLVYPINLVRTRLQTQGTALHPRTYTGILDVTRQTIQGEGVRGLFKGLTPNLLKVVPAVSITYVVYERSKRIMALD